MPEVKIPGLSTEERAAKLGFVRHLPQDTEVVLAFHNGTKTVDRVKSSKLWKLVQKQLGAGIGMAPVDDEEMDDKAPPEAAPADGADARCWSGWPSGTQFTMALGKSTADQAGNLLTLNRRMGYFQIRSATKTFLAAMKSGDVAALAESFSNGYGPELAKDLLDDPQSGLALVEKAKMPPIYLAFRTREADRAAAAQQVAAMVENVNLLGEMVEPIEIEQSGRKIRGIQNPRYQGLRHAGRRPRGDGGGNGIRQGDQLLAAMAKKDLVVVSGTVGDYVLLFLGGSADDFKLAGDVGQSLAASNALAFTDAYATKELAAVAYGQKEGMDTVSRLPAVWRT